MKQNQSCSRCGILIYDEIIEYDGEIICKGYAVASEMEIQDFLWK